MAVAGCTNSNDNLGPSVGAKPSSKDTNESSVPLDQASNTTAGAVVYDVPSTGGSVMVMGKSGIQVEFAVPASAAGKQITFTPTTAAEIGWNDPNFAEVIRMEPDGSKFAEPIVVRPSSKALIVLDFPSSPQKSVPEGLTLNAAKDGFLLYHFSTLVVFSPDYDCESQEGWVLADERTTAETCTDPAFPVMFKLNCLTHPYCLQIDAQCCAEKGAVGCDSASPTLSLSYSRADETGEEYAYCVAKEAELNNTDTSVCTEYEVGACECEDGSQGQHECLSDRSGWTECTCEVVDSGPAAGEAICPTWHAGDCIVDSDESCSCDTADGEHTYAVICDGSGTCTCAVDDVVIASFAFEENACASPDSIRERWYAHCAQGACP